MLQDILDLRNHRKGCKVLVFQGKCHASTFFAQPCHGVTQPSPCTDELDGVQWIKFDMVPPSHQNDVSE